MPAPLNVNREAVKTLAIAIGVRAAARDMNLEEDTVRQWSSREKWFDSPQAKTVLVNRRKAVSPNVTTVSPSEAIATRLARFKQRSVDALAEYSALAAEEALKSKSKLAISRKVKDVADVHKIVHPSEQNDAGILQIGILIHQS